MGRSSELHYVLIGENRGYEGRTNLPFHTASLRSGHEPVDDI
jgi:hypothetical protein